MKIPEKRFIKYPSKLYCAICVILSVLATVICVVGIKDVPSAFSYLWLLPFGNTIISILFYWLLLRGEFTFDFPAILITALFTIRNAITPWIMATTTCRSRLGIYSSAEMVNLGIIMFLYETLAVICFSVYRQTRGNIKRRIHVRGINITSNSLFYCLLAAGIGVTIVSFVVLPELRTQYYTIFTNDMTHLAKEYVTHSGGAKRALSTASGMIIESVRITLSSYVIFKLRQKKENWVTYGLSVAVILLQFLFMNDSNAYVLMIAISLFVLVMKLYPTYAKRTLMYLIIGGILFGVLLYLNRFSLDIYGSSLSVFLQAYFPGLNNFATIEPLLSRGIGDVIKQIFIDLYAAVPFRTALFGYSGNLTALPTLWAQSNGLSGQILPNIAQSYYYFGAVFAPILPIFLASVGLSSFEKARSTDNPCLFALRIYLSIYACVSITMYDTYIFMTNLLSRILFMWIFSRFCKDTFSQIGGSDV